MSTIENKESIKNSSGLDSPAPKQDQTIPRTMHSVTVSSEPTNNQRSFIQADVISDIQSLSEDVSLDSQQQKELVNNLSKQRDENSVQTTNFSEIPDLYTDLSVSPSKSRLDHLSDDDSEFSEPIDWVEAPDAFYPPPATLEPGSTVNRATEMSTIEVVTNQKESISLSSGQKGLAVDVPKSSYEQLETAQGKEISSADPERNTTKYENNGSSIPASSTASSSTKSKNNYTDGKRLSVISFNNNGANTTLDNNKALSTADIKSDNFYSNLLGNISINSSASSAIGGGASVVEFESKLRLIKDENTKTKISEDNKSTSDLKKELKADSDGLSATGEPSKSNEKDTKPAADPKLKFKSKTFHFGALLPMEKEQVDPFEPITHDSLSFENGINFIRSDYEHEIENLKEEIKRERGFQQEQQEQIQKLVYRLEEFERIAKKQTSLASKSSLEISSSPPHSRQGTNQDVGNAASLFKEFEAYKKDAAKKINHLDYLLKEEKTKTSRFEVLKIENDDLKSAISKKDETLDSLKDQNFALLKQLNDREKQTALSTSNEGSTNQPNTNNRVSIGQPGYVRQVRNSIMSPGAGASRMSPTKVTFADAVNRVIGNMEAEQYESQIRLFKENISKLQENIDAQNSTIESKDQTIESLENNLKELETQLKEIKDNYKVNNLLNQIETAKINVEVANREKADIEDKLCQSNSALANASNQLKEFHEFIVNADKNIVKINNYANSNYGSAKEEEEAFQDVKVLLAPQIGIFLRTEEQEIVSNIRRERLKVVAAVKTSHDMKRKYLEMEGELKAMKNKLETVESELDVQFKKTLEKITKEKSSLESQVVSLEYSKKDLENEVVELKRNCDEKQNEILELQDELKYVQSEWDLQYVIHNDSVKKSPESSSNELREKCKQLELAINELNSGLEQKEGQLQVYNHKIEQYESELQTLKGEFETKKQELSDLNGAISLKSRESELNAVGMSEKIVQLETTIPPLEKEIAKLKEENTKLGVKLQEKVEGENKNASDLQNQLSQLQGLLKEKDIHIVEANEKNLTIHEELQLQMKALEGEVLELKKASEDKEEISKLKEEIATLEWEKEKLLNEALYHSQKISDSNSALEQLRDYCATQDKSFTAKTTEQRAEYEQLEKKKAEAETSLNQLESDFSAKVKELDTLNSKHLSLITERETLKSDLLSLKQNEETQKDDVTAHQKEIQKLTSKISKLELGIKEMELQCNKLHLEIDAKSRDLKQLKEFSKKLVQENQGKVSQLEAKIDKQEEALSKLIKEINLKNEKINETVEHKQELETKKVLAEKQVATLEKSIAEMQERLNSVPTLTLDLAQAKETISVLEKKLSILEHQASTFKITEVEKTQLEQAKLELKEKKYMQSVEDAKELKRSLDEAETSLNNLRDANASLTSDLKENNRKLQLLKESGNGDSRYEELKSKYKETLGDLETVKNQLKSQSQSTGKNDYSKVEHQIENLDDLISSRVSLLNQIIQTWTSTSPVDKAVPTYTKGDFVAAFKANRKYVEAHFKMIFNLLDQLKLHCKNLCTVEGPNSDNALLHKTNALKTVMNSEVQIWSSIISAIKSFLSEFKNQVTHNNLTLDQVIQTDITHMKSLHSELMANTLKAENDDQIKSRAGFFDNPLFRDSIGKLQSEIQELKWREQIFEREVQNERHQNQIDKLATEDARREKRVLEGKASLLEKEFSKISQKVENYIQENVKLENQVQDLERQVAKRDSAIRQCHMDIQIEKDAKSTINLDLERLQQKIIDLNSQKIDLLKKMEKETELKENTHTLQEKVNGTVDLQIVEKLKKLESNVLQLSDTQAQLLNLKSTQPQPANIKQNCGNPTCNLDYIKKKVHKLEAEMQSKYKKKMKQLSEVYRKQLYERELLEQKRARNENLLKHSYEHRIKNLQRRLDSRYDDIQH
ncbi:hypothetical protein HDV01_006092 [Terramyces sp. JEL0728]|nr:hypothetical protein HDV01_006092 [Terramyces sp. JEL0728]